MPIYVVLIDIQLHVGKDAVAQGTGEFEEYCAKKRGTALSVTSQQEYDRVILAIAKWGEETSLVKKPFSVGHPFEFCTSMTYVNEVR